jgi:uncharacterized protein DUF3501
MDPIALEDVLGRERYASRRDAIRRRVIAHKQRRRVAVGDAMTLLFEDRATVWYQVQEVLWIEQITDLDGIRAELDVYNALLPGPSELSSTLLIAIEDERRVREELQRLVGIDRHVTLEVGSDARVTGVFEAGRQTEEKLSSVQYVRFPLDPSVRERVVTGAPLALAVDHPNYRARTAFPDAVRASVAAELAEPGVADRALREVRDGS